MGAVGKAVGGILGMGSMPKQTAAAEAKQAVESQPAVQPPAAVTPQPLPQLQTTTPRLTQQQVEAYIKDRTGQDITAQGGAADKIIKERGLEKDFAAWREGMLSTSANAAQSQNYVTQMIEPPGAPQESDRSVLAARDRERRRRLRMAEKNKTIVTGGQGVTASAPTASKQLFGQ